MKSVMKHPIVFALLASLCIVSPAFGAIEPPYKEIGYCYRIDNIDDYPGFMFVARFPDEEDMQLSEGGECFSRSSADEIVALRKDRPAEEAIRSGITAPVSPVKVNNLDDPRNKIDDVFTIDTIDGQTFSLRLAKKIVRYADWSIRLKVYATAEEGLADPPAPEYRYTDTPASPSTYWFDDERFGYDAQQSTYRYTPQKYVAPRTLARNIINIIFVVLELVSSLCLVIFGTRFIFDKDLTRRRRWKKHIYHSLIALIVFFLLWIIAYFVLTDVCCAIQR